MARVVSQTPYFFVIFEWGIRQGGSCSTIRFLFIYLSYTIIINDFFGFVNELFSICWNIFDITVNFCRCFNNCWDGDHITFCDIAFLN